MFLFLFHHYFCCCCRNIGGWSIRQRRAIDNNLLILIVICIVSDVLLLFCIPINFLLIDFLFLSFFFLEKEIAFRFLDFVVTMKVIISLLFVITIFWCHNILCSQRCFWYNTLGSRMGFCDCNWLFLLFLDSCNISFFNFNCRENFD